MTDHKGVFVYFLVEDKFDTREIGGSNKLQRHMDLTKAEFGGSLYFGFVSRDSH